MDPALTLGRDLEAPPEPRAAHLPSCIAIPGIALVSFAALLVELALTRLFSVVLFYHFAFLAISVALLGLGAGGVFAYLRRHSLARWETRRLAGALCAFNAVAIAVVLQIVLRVAVELDLTWVNFGRLTIIYLVSAIPFFFTGLLFSVVFAREPQRISQLYGADLVGASAACVALVPLLNYIGGPSTLLFSAAMMAAAVVVWANSRRARSGAIVLAGLILAASVANQNGKLVDIVYAKGKRRDHTRVEFARWNAISRVEVDRQGDNRMILIDADASTELMKHDPQRARFTRTYRDYMAASPALANLLRPEGKYAIIGPGGGVDVWRAIAAGSRDVTGIEINSIIANDIMRDRYARYSHYLYELPEVRIEVGDGRSFIRSSRERYDVLQMTLVDTWATTAAGAFALSENNLYTIEAFRDYFEHLRPDGFIAITRWEFKEPREALRVVSQAMAALHQLGIAECREHFIVIADGSLNEDGRPVTVLAKRSPFTREEEARVRAQVERNSKLSILYLPSDPPAIGSFVADSSAFNRLITSNDPNRFAAKYPYNVAPVDDDAPFFFFTMKLDQLWNPGRYSRAMDWKVNLGVVVLVILLLVALVAVLTFLVFPMTISTGLPQRHLLRLLYFVAVGLGYILVEIAFIQRFVLFLGHPTYALTVVVFLMLLSSGVGSMLARRWTGGSRPIRVPLALVIAFLSAYLFVLPRITTGLVGLPLPLRLVASVLLLIPPALVMGMAFPVGLRVLSSGGEQGAIEWAWAMNAAASVLGSVLAIAVAITFGITFTLACGVTAYIFALLLTPALVPRSPAGGF